MGGAGVWWPNRSLTEASSQPESYRMTLSSAETEVGYHKFDENGLRVYVPVGGYAGTSTRTELAAGILALMAHGPIHLASDSKAFVDRANKYLSMLRKRKQPKRPWKLISDGDLWEHFWKAAEAKTPSAIAIVWVKGHATQQHIDQGITTQEKLVGNKEADDTADLGTAIFGKTAQSLADTYHTRHSLYSAFMGLVSRFLVEGYIIHRQLTDQWDKKQASLQQQQPNTFDYSKLTYASCRTECIHITPNAHVKQFRSTPGLNHNQVATVDVHNFLCETPIATLKKGDRAITWLELYILYRIRGYHQPITNPPNKAKMRATADKQLKAFKNLVRLVYNKILEDTEFLSLLKPHNHTLNTLKGVGLEGKHASPSFNVYISEKEQHAIGKEILQLTRTLSGVKINQVLQGERKLKPIQLKLNGKAAWDNSIQIHANHTVLLSSPSGSSSSTSIVDTVCYPTSTHLNRYAEGLPSFLECPTCRKLEHNTQPKFQTYDLDVKTKCFHCGSQIRVMDWKCTCNVKWYKCNLHAKIANEPLDKRKASTQLSAQCTSKAKVERCSMTVGKRSLDAQSISEQVDGQEQTPQARQVKRPRQMEPSPWISLGNPKKQGRRYPSALGPVLAKRFRSLYR